MRRAVLALLLPRLLRLPLLLPMAAALIAGLPTAITAATPAPAAQASTADGDPATGVPRSVTLAPQLPHRLIAGDMQVLEDPGGQLTPEQVMQIEQGWRFSDADAVRLGPSRSAFWLRVRVIHGGVVRGRYVLMLGSARQDHVRWVEVAPNGVMLRDQVTGDRLPRSTRVIQGIGMALPLWLQPREHRDVYIRVQSHDGLIEPLPVRLATEEGYDALSRDHLALHALFTGALLALILYNGFLWASTRAPEFGAYVVYGAGLLTWNIGYYGFGFHYLWPDSPRLNHALPLIGAAVGYAGGAMFIPTYLRLKERAGYGRVLRFYRASALASLACIVPALADQYTLATFLSFAVGLPLLLYTPWLSLTMARQGVREGAFLAVAFTATVVSLLYFYAELFGWLPITPIGQYSIQIGCFLEMTLLALGLAHSMNQLKAQKIEAERQALQAQRALAHSLERQVAERTRELELANRRLGQLAITDELTGAFNRRRFNEACAIAMARPLPRAPMALGMFDLDHFKRYNDRYGHQAGDAVLRSVAQTVTLALDGRGELFRLGGEEFGILFAADSAAHAHALVDTLRLAILSLGIEHLDSGAGVVTASFGVLWCGCSGADSPDADALYAAADGALYQAKHQGRNRVVVQPVGGVPALASAPTAQTVVREATGSLA